MPAATSIASRNLFREPAVIVERNPRRDFAPHASNKLKNFSGRAMPAKATTRAPFIASAASASGAKCAAMTGLLARAAMSRPRAPSPMTTSISAAASCASSGARKGPAGHAAAVARAIVRVDDDERQVGRDATAVEAVVENDDTCAEALAPESALAMSICADDRRRDARKQQRFVADVVRVVTHRGPRRRRTSRRACGDSRA